MELTSIIRCIVLVSSYILLIETQTISSAADFFLEGKTFLLDSKIKYFQQKDGINRFVTLHEKYSNEQQRAKLYYKVTENKLKFGTTGDYYFYDSTNSVSLFYNELNKKCYTGDISFLYSYLFPSIPLSGILNSRNLFNQDNKNLNYIVGPARLMFLIFHYWNETKLSEFEENGEVKIRNHVVVEYDLKLEVDAKTLEFRAFYDKESHVSGSYRNSIPLQIEVLLRLADEDRNYISIVVDYYNFKILPSNKIQTDIGDGYSERSREIIVDQFSFPLQSSCPDFDFDDENQHLETNNNNNSRFFNILTKMQLEKTKFSFNAMEISSLVERKGEHFVAFDGTTLSLRVDLRGQHSNTMVIYDFRLNKRYFIAENEHGSKIIRNLPTEEQRFLFENQCSIFEAIPEREFKNSNNHKLKSILNVLFGSEKFNYMGLARVRGINARVFEAHDTSVPIWFDQPLVVYTDNNSHVERLGRFDKINKTKKDYFDTIVYVSRQDNDDTSNHQPPRVLLIETHNKREDPNNFQGFLANVYNFIWELNNSLNDEDKADELFQLKDRCSSSLINQKTVSGSNRYAEINLLLEHKQSINQSTIDTSAATWVDQSTKERNQALLASLIQALNLQTSMVSNLNSKIIINHYDKFKSIAANLRVAEYSNIFHNIQFLGFGLADFKHPDAIILDKTQSLAECLSVFSSNLKPIYVYYYKPSKYSCLLDGSLLNHPLTHATLNDSKVLQMTRLEIGGQIYRIDPVKDDQLVMTNIWFRSLQFQHLENKEIVLKNPNHEEEEMKFRIRRIDVNTLVAKKESNKINQLESSPDSLPLSGFGFVISNSSKSIVKLTNELETQEQCHAACLTDLNCKSYSFCIHLLEPDCKLSNISFTITPDMRARLYDKTQMKLLKSGKISVKLDSHDGQFVDLIKNPKCELRNKFYLELFKPAYLLRAFIKFLKISPVSDEESCAKICFQKNLNTIRASLKLTEDLRNLFKPGSSTVDYEKVKLEVEQIRFAYRQLSSNFCDKILYIDESKLDSSQSKLLKEVVNNNNNNNNHTSLNDSGDNINGYCILPSEVEEHDSGNKLDHIMLPAREFKFDFTRLYQKTSGIRMIESTFEDQDELSGYLDMSAGRPIKNDKLIKRMMSHKKNFQFRVFDNPSYCAEKCLLQSSGLWPSCGSFDVVSEQKSLENSKSSYCLLNTMSLNEFDDGSRNSMISSSNTTTVQLWHYELKFWSHSREQSYFECNAAAVEPLESTNQFEISGKEIDTNLSLGWLATMFVILLGLSSGFAMGIKIAMIIIDNQTNRDINVPVFTLDSLEIEDRNYD